MTSATMDVNVTVPGFATTLGTSAVLIQRWLSGDFEVALSEVILAKTAVVWGRPYWTARYAPGQVRTALDLLRQLANIVVPDPDVRGVAEDEEDDLVLASAVAGNVDFLVTGDHRFLAVGSSLERVMDLVDWGDAE